MFYFRNDFSQIFPVFQHKASTVIALRIVKQLWATEKRTKLGHRKVELICVCPDTWGWACWEVVCWAGQCAMRVCSWIFGVRSTYQSAEQAEEQQTIWFGGGKKIKSVVSVVAVRCISSPPITTGMQRDSRASIWWNI